MRIYLPCTLPALAEILAEGRVGGEPLTAFAVTGALRATGGDAEGLEYEAMLSAGDAALRLLAADPGAPRRRVVLAADMPEGAVTEDADLGGPAAVRVDGSVPYKKLASAHVDDAGAEEGIARAVADPEAGHQDDHDLMWYAVQELKYLVE